MSWPPCAGRGRSRSVYSLHHLHCGAVTGGCKSMVRPSSRFAIVGRPAWAGLAAAAALRRVGHRRHGVPSRRHNFARIGAGIQIGCNAMKVLRALGARVQICADKSFYTRRSWNNRDWRTGEVQVRHDFSAETAEQKFWRALFAGPSRRFCTRRLVSAVPRGMHQAQTTNWSGWTKQTMAFDWPSPIGASAVADRGGPAPMAFHSVVRGHLVRHLHR